MGFAFTPLLYYPARIAWILEASSLGWARGGPDGRQPARPVPATFNRAPESGKSARHIAPPRALLHRGFPAIREWWLVYPPLWPVAICRTKSGRRAGGGEILEAEHQLDGLGTAGDADERHRVRPQNDDCQSQVAARLQGGVPGTAAVSLKAPRERAVEMTGRWKAWETTSRFPPLPPAPLEISQGRRDSHIPTARRRPAGECGKPKSGFPHSPATLATATASPSSEQQNQTLGRSARKTGERPPAAHPQLPFQYHLALETKVGFSIILGLENA